jgi:hypothetical protein
VVPDERPPRRIAAPSKGPLRAQSSQLHSQRVLHPCDGASKKRSVAAQWRAQDDDGDRRITVELPNRCYLDIGLGSDDVQSGVAQDGGESRVGNPEALRTYGNHGWQPSVAGLKPEVPP